MIFYSYNNHFLYQNVEKKPLSKLNYQISNDYSSCFVGQSPLKTVVFTSGNNNNDLSLNKHKRETIYSKGY